MQLLNSKYIYAGLLQGFAQLYQKTHSKSSFNESWQKLSDKYPWLFTEEVKAIFTEEIFEKISSFTNCKPEGDNNGLKSIFSELLSEKGDKPENINGYFKPVSFQLGDSIFPVDSNNLNVEALLKLWKECEDEMQNLKDNHADQGNFTALYEILKKYASKLSIPKRDVVNIFENAKLNAALLHSSSLAESNGLPFLLVSGDISGIQPFIYNISSKRAMVSLKGRSFYVQLLAETIAAELTDACGVALTHQVYAAGGKFYMLCPNTTLVNESINNYKKSIQEWVWDKFKGKISLQIETVAFDLKMQGKQLFAETITDSHLSLGYLWKTLSDKTSESKKRKFEHLLVSRFEEFFNPSGLGGEIKVCAVSNEELNSNNSVVITKDSEDQQELIVSKEVNEQINIGKKLFSAKFLVDTGTSTENSFQIGLHTYWELLGQLPSKAVNRCLAINQQMVVPVIKANMIIESRLFGGIPMAGSKDNPATLEDLCKNEDRIENLGILRMDVDNLGSLFMDGFGPSSEFSLMATLSAALETYFSGYLNTIRNQEKYSQYLNIVYAGGDDVFAVGRWDKIFEFAIEVKAGFKKMVCGREDISISGGIAITGAKFPISKAAELAAEAEDLAKDFKLNDKQKNSLTLFGIPVSFETEMPFVIELKDDLKEWLENKQISKGLLFKLFEYYQLYLHKKPDWQWQSAYTIARYEETCSKEQKAIYTLLKELLFTKMYKNKFHNVRFEAIIVACRWAELLTKNHKTNA